MAKSSVLKQKCLDGLFFTNMEFWLHKMLIDGLEWCGLLWFYYFYLLLTVLIHSDGTHSLQWIHWWASDRMLHFSKFDEETNSYILDGLKMSNLSANFHFWVDYSFKDDLNIVFYLRKTAVFSLEVVKLLCRNRNEYQSGSLWLLTGTLHLTATQTDPHSFDLPMLQSQH